MIFVIALMVWVAWYVIQEKDRKIAERVESISSKVNEVKELNKLYEVAEINISDININFDNKRMYDSANLENILVSYMGKGINNLPNHATVIEKTLVQKARYDSEIAAITEKTTTKDYEFTMPLEKYIKLEDEIISKYIFKFYDDQYFYVNVSYTSPKGKSSYNAYWKVYYTSLPKYKKKSESSSTYQSHASYERSLMTPGLRHDILKRDNFRCQYCGATANDGVKLHIDHIHPVSKGGKTVKENLQTLCERCNIGKGAKY